MEERITAPIRLQAATQFIPAIDGVDSLVLDDLFE
jgi:hypothetical protein